MYNIIFIAFESMVRMRDANILLYNIILYIITINLKSMEIIMRRRNGNISVTLIVYDI